MDKYNVPSGFWMLSEETLRDIRDKVKESPSGAVEIIDDILREMHERDTRRKK